MNRDSGQPEYGSGASGFAGKLLGKYRLLRRFTSFSLYFLQLNQGLEPVFHFNPQFNLEYSSSVFRIDESHTTPVLEFPDVRNRFPVANGRSSVRTISIERSFRTATDTEVVRYEIVQPKEVLRTMVNRLLHPFSEIERITSRLMKSTVSIVNRKNSEMKQSIPGKVHRYETISGVVDYENLQLTGFEKQGMGSYDFPETIFHSLERLDTHHYSNPVHLREENRSSPVSDVFFSRAYETSVLSRHAERFLTDPGSEPFNVIHDLKPDRIDLKGINEKFAFDFSTTQRVLVNSKSVRSAFFSGSRREIHHYGPIQQPMLFLPEIPTDTQIHVINRFTRDFTTMQASTIRMMERFDYPQISNRELQNVFLTHSNEAKPGKISFNEVWTVELNHIEKERAENESVPKDSIPEKVVLKELKTKEVTSDPFKKIVSKKAEQQWNGKNMKEFQKYNRNSFTSVSSELPETVISRNYVNLIDHLGSPLIFFLETRRAQEYMIERFNREFSSVRFTYERMKGNMSPTSSPQAVSVFKVHRHIGNFVHLKNHSLNIVRRDEPGKTIGDSPEQPQQVSVHFPLSLTDRFNKNTGNPVSQLKYLSSILTFSSRSVHNQFPRYSGPEFDRSNGHGFDHLTVQVLPALGGDSIFDRHEVRFVKPLDGSREHKVAKRSSSKGLLNRRLTVDWNIGFAPGEFTLLSHSNMFNLNPETAETAREFTVLKHESLKNTTVEKPVLKNCGNPVPQLPGFELNRLESRYTSHCMVLESPNKGEPVYTNDGSALEVQYRVNSTIGRVVSDAPVSMRVIAERYQPGTGTKKSTAKNTGEITVNDVFQRKSRENSFPVMAHHSQDETGISEDTIKKIEKTIDIRTKEVQERIEKNISVGNVSNEAVSPSGLKIPGVNMTRLANGVYGMILDKVKRERRMKGL